AYSDGVEVRITGAEFAEETAEGPGAFTGREYARLSITLSNGSDSAIDLNTAVLTLLDADSDEAVKVYAAEAKTKDFSGTLKPGDAAKGVYAFAVPEDARDAVTLVVDFDARHTSAVFRGGLS